jgi:hypothetical protein
MESGAAVLRRLPGIPMLTCAFAGPAKLSQAAQITLAVTYHARTWQNAEYPITEGKKACR